MPTTPLWTLHGMRPPLDIKMYVDIGAYGIPRQVLDKQPFDAVGTAQKVESYVASVHGFQMLYADSYLTRDEFRDMFDHEHYDSMKARYDTHGAFPEVRLSVSLSEARPAAFEDDPLLL